MPLRQDERSRSVFTQGEYLSSTFARDFGKITPSVPFFYSVLPSFLKWKISSIIKFSERAPVVDFDKMLVSKKMVETLAQFKFYLMEGNQIPKETEKDILGSRSATTKQLPVRFCIQIHKKSIFIIHVSHCTCSLLLDISFVCMYPYGAEIS